MKSETSSFKTVLRKDVTRFAPLWAIYLIGGLLVVLSITDYMDAEDVGRYLSNTIGPFSIINMIYAGLAAQLLFGDLFNSRLCNALHAMPMRRETWFAAHIISGFLYSVVPHAIAMLLILPRLGEFWFLAFVWMLAMALGFLFFFGLAVFSVFCTGNRFAMTAVYAILNFLSLIAWWFVATIYEPVLFGVSIKGDWFSLFCPVVKLCSLNQFVIFKHQQYQGLGDWSYLIILAVLGVALLGASLLMYRRRALESAGDFMAVRPLAPVFSVVYTLCVGAVFAMFGQLFGDGYLLFLFIGIAVGYFTGQMLLQRSLRVFKAAAFGKLALLAVLLVASVFLVRWDPAGITRWVPQENQVEKVTISNTPTFYEYNASTITLREPEEIEKVLQAHQSILDNRDREDDGNWQTIAFRYYLKDGTVRERNYTVRLTDEAVRLLSSLYVKPEQVLGYSDWDAFLTSVKAVYVEHATIEDLEKCHELVKAIRADCEEGNMTQYWRFRWDDSAEYCLYIMIERIDSTGSQITRSLDIYSDAKHTLQWLRENEDVWNTDGKYDFTFLKKGA